MSWNVISIYDIKAGDRIRATSPNKTTTIFTVESAIGRSRVISGQIEPGQIRFISSSNQQASFSSLSDFEIWTEDKIDLDKIREGDTVTLELDAKTASVHAKIGTFTVTGTVYRVGQELFVGGHMLRKMFPTAEHRKVTAHTPAPNPEWWSWPLIEYKGHVYGLDTVTNRNDPFHTHGRAYCGCDGLHGNDQAIWHGRSAIVPRPDEIKRVLFSNEQGGVWN